MNKAEAEAYATRAVGEGYGLGTTWNLDDAAPASRLRFVRALLQDAYRDGHAAGQGNLSEAQAGEILSRAQALAQASDAQARASQRLATANAVVPGDHPMLHAERQAARDAYQTAWAALITALRGVMAPGTDLPRNP